MAELEEIIDHINHGRNFLLSGGAGSGKTYSLVQVIRKVIEDYSSSQIMCITYTNAAVREIQERVDHHNLTVRTIHEFLWAQIKNYQKELKSCLVELANDEEESYVKIDDVEPVPNDFFDGVEEGIQYKEYLRLKDGIISHDQVIVLSEIMFRKYPKLGDIVKDKFDFIFIDEYQDTHREVVQILLEHFKQTPKRNIVGFFGDAMQSIYNKRIGNLDEYKGDNDDEVREVKKEQNRRNPLTVINLANQLRTDGITQVPSDDPSSPNMDDGEVKQGEIKFIYSEISNVDRVKEYLGWDFTDSKNTKELNLTHNLIADKANFQQLMNIYDNDKIIGRNGFKKRIKDYLNDNPVEIDLSEMTFGEVVEFLQEGKTGQELNKVTPTNGQRDFIQENHELWQKAKETNYEIFSRIYVDKDQLLDDKKQDEDEEKERGSKRDELIKHLFRLQEIIWLYKNGQYNEFLKITDFIDTLVNVKKKQELKEKIESLINVGDKKIGEVIDEAHEHGILIKGDGIDRFIERKKYVFDQVKEIPFRVFQDLFEFLEGRTPFTTQHKTKGTEFDNVFIILDNGGWTSYNFKYLFERNGTTSVIERTQKLFYVCCTRTKEKLAVYYHNPSNAVIEKAKEWFEEENVINLDL